MRNMHEAEVWTEMTQAFTFVEETLVYVDAPLEGHLLSRDGEVFAFRCGQIIDGRLWHWVLLPVPSSSVTVEAAFAAAAHNPPDRWLSIIEDRRSRSAQLTAVAMSRSDRLPRNP